MACGAFAVYGHSSSYVHIDHLSHGHGHYDGGYDHGYDDHHDYHVSCTFVIKWTHSVKNVRKRSTEPITFKSSLWRKETIVIRRSKLAVLLGQICDFWKEHWIETTSILFVRIGTSQLQIRICGKRLAHRWRQTGLGIAPWWPCERIILARWTRRHKTYRRLHIRSTPRIQRRCQEDRPCSSSNCWTPWTFGWLRLVLIQSDE